MAGILGFTSPDAVDVELPLRDIGIDSLTAALLRNRHAARTSRALAAIVAFDHQNLRALSQYLLSQLQESWKDASTTAQESDDATTATAASTSPGNAPLNTNQPIGNDTSTFLLSSPFTVDESLNIVHERNTALDKMCGVFAGISVTASLNVRFVAPIATTEEVVCVTTWAKKIRGCYTTMKAELTNAKGERLAEAEDVFVGVDSANSWAKS
ncbi:hypothetical protein F5B18DRAFT_653233 [Nemania serpens]|nr:hypothetical protein F5B18DRAFT_653233 [Nemania serpens]